MFGALLLFEEDFLHIVSITFTSLILTELLMVALTIRTWHYLMLLAELLSFGFYVICLVIFQDYFGKLYCIHFGKLYCVYFWAHIPEVGTVSSLGHFSEESVSCLGKG